MNWAQRRQLLYLFCALVVVGAVTLALVRKATNVTPTCFDRKQNSDEVGIDCGGSCTLYCPSELANPKVRWVRSFTIAPGVVHSVAYIEHSYPTAAAQAMRYTFKLYDERNTLITERSGTTFLGPMGRTALVETLIPTNNSTVATTRFTIDGTLAWQKIPILFSQVVIKSDNTTLEDLATGTRLTAILENQSRLAFKDMDVVAIIYDESDNAVTVSESLLPSLGALEKTTVYFTWPFRITTKVGRIEIVPRFNPFTATAL